MNKKAVVFLVMMGIIVVLLGINILIFKGREDENAFKMDNQEQNVLNAEEETESVVSEVDKEISSAEQNAKEFFAIATIVLDKEAASSWAAELATASGREQAIFGETYYESDELEIEGESESESEQVAR
ncbi:MAG: hypothetical protein IJB96_00055 [Lachnospira sp.]|nr:hypothetical protein [Lachnospira sp.]